jgi:two-component system, LytTR family, response regulator
MIQSIIVENDLKQSQYLQGLLSRHFPEINILAVCAAIPEAISKVAELKPELLFLDIELPPYTGFDLLEKTRSQKYEVIFMTAHNKYAVKAIKFSALDFLEKPYDLSDLHSAISRFKDKSSQSASIIRRDTLLENVQHAGPFKKININFKNEFESILIQDIIMLESKEGDSYIYLNDGRQLISSKSLNYYQDLLSDYAFCRTHSRYLINLKHVLKYKSVKDGGLISLSNKLEADVSRKWKEEFLTLYNQISIGKVK